MQNNLTLYSLSKDLEQLQNELLESADEETGELDNKIVEAVDKLQGTFEEKAVKVAMVYKNFDSFLTSIEAEEKRLKALKEKVEREKERVEKYITRACETTGTTRIEGVQATISFRKSEKVVVDNESLIPEEFMKVKTTYEPDKTKIKKAIKNGEEVLGASLQTTNNIQIK